MKLFDNINSLLSDDLKTEIKKDSKLAIAASTFSIYAFEELKKELKNIEELRFIFTSPSFVEEKFQKETREFYIPHIYNESSLCGGEFELRLKNKLNQRAIAKECSKWVKDKVTFKSNKHLARSLNGLISIQQNNNNIAYTGLNGFTTSDLGTTHKADSFPTLISRVDFPESKAYLEHFNQIWSDQENLTDVTSAVQEYFNNAFKENAPEFIYFITLYNIFNEFLNDLSLDALPNDQIGFKETKIWSMLYNFQRDAVIGGINKLEKYNGCIVADSVGLGKTFTALGIIKYYEKRNKDVLVLCPKKLEDNWNTFRHNDKDNILAQDKFGYDVLFHTDLSREKGTSNGRDLAKVNWGNYGLVVIDESHNFRNNNTVVGKENRYQRLMRKIIREGIETKVLMLSATPVNNRFNDLKNQLALAYEGNPEKLDNKLETERGIESIFRSTQKAFNKWSKLPVEERTTEALLDTLDFDFFEILDNLTIARSRKHITTYYDTSAIGEFPKRNKPVSIRAALAKETTINFKDIAEKLTLLNLAIYSPVSYLLQSKISLYADLYDKDVKSGRFKQTDREKHLQILMRMNLLKRIESSVEAFRLTIENILNQIYNAIKLITENEDAEYSGIQLLTKNDDMDWDPDWGDEENLIGKKIKVHVNDIDKPRWQEDLDADREILEELLFAVKDIDRNKDLKLNLLIDNISNKIENPVNEGNKKIIIFSAFADTANYLYKNLGKQFLKQHNIHTALITGSKRSSTAKSIPGDINAILSCFSPRSKNKPMVYPELNEEIDILIATDCIAEGQNLQDCDYLINYDIHWNPVRIIQRFGRIDRIGSINTNITMVNFWPDVELDTYINLKQRVESRMLIANMAGTGDDNILDTEQEDLEYRKIQLQKLQDEVVDLEELKEGVSITDLGLNDFRIDLSNYIKEYGELKNMPEGLHAVAKSTELLPKGVIFVLKNVNSKINIDKLNRLHPYYLVYLNNEGQLVNSHVDAKKILDKLRLLCKDKKEPLEFECKSMAAETSEYKKMDKYSGLLRKSINSIMETEDEKEVLSLFKSGGTTINQHIKGIEDFKLVSFIIVK